MLVVDGDLVQGLNCVELLSMVLIASGLDHHCNRIYRAQATVSSLKLLTAPSPESRPGVLGFELGPGSGQIAIT